ncbi:serine/threonine protein kinase [Brasilonema octagenarum UFV-E1]|uniref:Serine/threonine protein kinase n=2 Tax=Bromeliae group (in: Brasilonema) TaxID=3398495 RepID=A0A856MLF9_9CYAN|nr:serine/threonine protein kinase [Brasilonema sennae CENA114]QDL16380.1 serine/threonine protein kinase [Brasilonema octagenarum UFV-E1]
MFWGEGQLIHNGKYKIERQLGGGGFAVTYQAIHTQLNRRVVIKTPNLSVQNDPDYLKYLKRFKKEAQMLGECCADSHPHIVQVFDFFEEDGRSCLVMQYIPGESLWQFVQSRGALPETQAVKYIRQIGVALVEVHKKSIFHLDVTPPNIMLSFEPAVPNSCKAVLIDFGIAGDMSPPSTLSRTFGNKAFAPYELVRKGIRHPTVDVYCLAASLYYAVTGQRPTNSFDRFDDEELVPPKKLVPSLSKGVNQVILQGMALEAKDRPQTMQEWVKLLLESTPQPTPSRKQGPDYSNLENLLIDKKWREADEETARVMLKVVGREKQGWLDVKDIDNFPCTDLRTIDQLWVTYSDRHFGFSVQKRIWQECGAKVDYETECKLGDRVGWRKNGFWVNYDERDFSLNAPRGLLPSCWMVFSVGRWGGLWFSSLTSKLVKCNI